MEKQAEVVQAPPPYTEQSGYPPQPANPPPQQPGYQPQPAYPPQGQPGYPPQGQPGYQQGYPPQGQQGYPPQGYPQQGYPPPAQPAYPVYQQPAPTVIAPVQQISNNVTVVQANAPQTIVAQVYPPDHCTLAWFACLCCFCPLGICAIYNASNTRDAIDRGDIDAAYHSSMMARKFANWSIGVGVLMIILIIIINVVNSSSR